MPRNADASSNITPITPNTAELIEKFSMFSTIHLQLDEAVKKLLAVAEEELELEQSQNNSDSDKNIVNASR